MGEIYVISAKERKKLEEMDRRIHDSLMEDYQGPSCHRNGFGAYSTSYKERRKELRKKV